MDIVPFLLFILCCFGIVGIICLLFYILVRFGRAETDELRSFHCPQCQTLRKPRKTGNVRNLIEDELQCPVCGYISWDVPPKTSLSSRPVDKTDRQR